MDSRIVFFKKDFLYKDRTVVNIFSDNSDQDTVFSNNNCTRFVICPNGRIRSKKFTAESTFAVSTNGEFSIKGDWIVLETPGYNFPEDRLSFAQPGHLGNLSYIDGCSNSNLIDPPRNGDPCINYLYFPPQINQTFHTHPSVRIGTILSGKGFADLGDKKIELTPGLKFVLDRHVMHRFYTEDQHLSIMIFHPDSEDGPRDENNPMKTRTYLK